MAGFVPAPGGGARDLAAPIPGTHAPPVVRGADNIPVPAGGVSVAAVPADVFESWNGVRAAFSVHCPAGLNHAVRLAHAIRLVF